MRGGATKCCHVVLLLSVQSAFTLPPPISSHVIHEFHGVLPPPQLFLKRLATLRYRMTLPLRSNSMEPTPPLFQFVPAAGSSALLT